jgi:hypothetical protein
MLRSKFAALLMITLLGAGCALNADRDSPAQVSKAAPEPGPADNQGKVAYQGSEDPVFMHPELEYTPVNQDDNEHPETVLTETCVYSQFVHIVEPELVEKVSLPRLYDTISFEESEMADGILKQADHAHLTAVELYSTSDDPLDFLSWIKIWVDDGMLAWGHDLETSQTSITLDLDGSRDLAPLLKDKLHLRADIRAKSPRRDLWLGGVLHFDVYHECEWR